MVNATDLAVAGLPWDRNQAVVLPCILPRWNAAAPAVAPSPGAGALRVAPRAAYSPHQAVETWAAYRLQVTYPWLALPGFELPGYPEWGNTKFKRILDEKECRAFTCSSRLSGAATLPMKSWKFPTLLRRLLRAGGKLKLRFASSSTALT